MVNLCAFRGRTSGHELDCPIANLVKVSISERRKGVFIS